MSGLDQRGVRCVMLAAQGLLRPLGRPAQKQDVLEAIRQVQALQIDTISVVARAPYLSLWSRLGDYRPAWLDECLAEGALFEYWSHAACFLPIEDYALYRRWMVDRQYRYYSEEWQEQNRAVIEMVLGRIREEGALRSADFVNSDRAPGGWWNWKIEKNVLEHLHNSGTLMIARRKNFQRLYDLRERVLPDWQDEHIPSTEEVKRALLLKAVLALGVARRDWPGAYFYLKKNGTDAMLTELVQQGVLQEVEVEGWECPGLVHPQNAALVAAAQRGELEPTLTTFLSPFDSLIWDRARTRDLFGFDFSLECYLPPAKRRYGYFLLPVLHRGELVGRLDAKAHRSDGIFEVRGLFMEPGYELKGDLAQDFERALQDCANWHGTPEVQWAEGALKTVEERG